MTGALFPSLIGNVIQVAFRVGHVVVDRRGEDATTNGHNANDHFDSPSGGDEMAQHTFAAAHRHLVGRLTQDLLNRQGLNLVVDLGAGSVSVDVTDVGRVQAA